MPNIDLSILVVDDAKFSSSMIAKKLTNAGYSDIRIANDARSALKMMAQRKASVLVADWLMPEMDGLELTENVRQMDEQNNHFTYVILLTAKEGTEALTEAFDKGVDDFIFKSEMASQLLSRVFAADRMADRMNTILQANQLLLENNRHFAKRNVIDLETGVGNERYSREMLEKLMKHTNARGGATSYMLIKIKNWAEVKQKNNHMICEEVALGIARRLHSLIRPLDNLCRISEDHYAVIAHFTHIDHCSLNSYKRIHDGINHKSFRTSSGYISVSSASAVCTIDDKEPSPAVTDVEQGSMQLLKHAIETDTVSISRWKSEQAATS